MVDFSKQNHLANNPQHVKTEENLTVAKHSQPADWTNRCVLLLLLLLDS